METENLTTNKIAINNCELRNLIDEGNEEEVKCKYLVRNYLALRCITRNGLAVYATNNGDWWSEPRVIGTERELSKDVVETGEFIGTLKRYKYGGLDVVELRAHKVLMVEVWQNDLKLVGETVWIELSSFTRLARLLARYVPAEVAIDLASMLMDPDNVEAAKKDVRWALSLLYVEFPEPPLQLMDQAKVHFEVWESKDWKYGRALKVKTIAKCRYYRFKLEGGREGIGIVCTANEISKERQCCTIAEVNGFYLLSTPQYVSAFIEDGELKCFDVGRGCEDAIVRAAQRGILWLVDKAPGSFMIITEGEGFKAYSVYVGVLGISVSRIDVGNVKIDILAGATDSIMKQVESVLTQCDGECRKRVLKPVASALKHVHGVDLPIADLINETVS